MWLTWLRTVIGEMNSRAPISALASPSARSASTSSSRLDSSGIADATTGTAVAGPAATERTALTTCAASAPSTR